MSYPHFTDKDAITEFKWFDEGPRLEETKHSAF